MENTISDNLNLKKQGEVGVTILLPAYNEEDSIAQVIDGINSVMKNENYRYEILVVDDNSQDRTAQISKQKGAYVIKRSFKGGTGAARKTGILNARGNTIVMLDADGTYSTGDIPRLLSYFPEFDQVNGARKSEQGTLKFLRYPAKWFIKQLACYLTNTKIPDLNTGLKAFKKDIMLRYLWVIPDGFSCVTTMTLAFLINGYAVKYVSTEYYQRKGGRSKFHPVKDTFNYIMTVIRMVMYFNPLKIFLPLSLGLLFIGISKTIFDWFFVVRKMQLSDIVIILAALMIGILGLIADLIVAQAKARDSRDYGKRE